MARAQRTKPRTYRFKMDAFTPATISMRQLADYLYDLAMLFGNEDHVHLAEIEEGSTVLKIPVDYEAQPKVQERLGSIRRNDGPPEAMNAAREIDERLRRDNARGSILAPKGGKVLVFPGRDLNRLIEYGPFNQPGTLTGIPIRVGGEQEMVHVHLEEPGPDGRKFNCTATRSKAKDIARYLFNRTITVDGVGRWVRRRNGEWDMVSFTIKDFEPMPEGTSLKNTIQRLRAIPAKWKELEDPVEALTRLRHGTDG